MPESPEPQTCPEGQDADKQTNDASLSHVYSAASPAARKRTIASLGGASRTMALASRPSRHASPALAMLYGGFVQLKEKRRATPGPPFR